MPLEPRAARTWLDRQERRDRKNARVIDKLVLALPRELHPLQRRKLVRNFAEEITKGRASWLAALHQSGKDAHNPHAHVIIRDRDPETGKRVALLSEKGSTDTLRALWDRMANEALMRAGRPERIGHRRARTHQGSGAVPAPLRRPRLAPLPPAVQPRKDEPLRGGFAILARLPVWELLRGARTAPRIRDRETPFEGPEGPLRPS